MLHCYCTVHCREDPIDVFPEMKRRGLVPNIHIHVSVEQFIFPLSVLLFSVAKWEDRSWEYKNRSQKQECGNWEWGCDQNNFQGLELKYLFQIFGKVSLRCSSCQWVLDKNWERIRTVWQFTIKWYYPTKEIGSSIVVCAYFNRHLGRPPFIQYIMTTTYCRSLLRCIA